MNASLFDEIPADLLRETSDSGSIISALIQLNQQAAAIENTIQSNINEFKDKYNKIYTWQDLISSVFTFSSRYKSIITSKENHMMDYTSLLISAKRFDLKYEAYKLNKEIRIKTEWKIFFRQYYL